MVTCGLCGLRYEPGGADCRAGGCPLAGGCHMEHCPRCGYAVPSLDAGFAGWLRRFLSSGPPSPPGRRLSDLQPGCDAVVERVEAPPSIAAQLTLLGVTPGARLRLLQRVPAFVVDAEGTELALERDVAGTVWMEPVPREKENDRC
jgi:Fe2+ transport system protein FeoA